MDRPKIQPTSDMLAASAVGSISSMTYNKEATNENFDQAEYHSHGGSFNYEAVIDLVGDKGACSINESSLPLIEFYCTDHSTGCWILNKESRDLCEEWLKWIKSEERELTTYRRLQKKFAHIGDES